ncbi:uncharacterized protein OCT59_018644 [Rhizophagus irregularis]|uniref:uncharacterized protein n=1 Tax=Rhizophagus irregularis TaxID=588596 RepID=UPI0019EEE5C5|nr:hypothetical protein OCT59_018644 [Rhizophagus irregularis]GBC42490.2 hypothetical protein GLOIN_2v473602 [Rhizophagus irregularis DAOM 181602=DAOM 197198]
MVQSLKNYIVKTNKKSRNNNLYYCKACFTKLGENSLELKTIIDKTERLITHFKNCRNFYDTYDNDEKSKVFALGMKKNNLMEVNTNDSSINNYYYEEIQFHPALLYLPFHPNVEELDKTILEKLKLDQIEVTMSFDSWTNVREQELMETVLVTSDGQPFAWQAKDISCEHATTTEVMSKTEGMISEINKMKITLLAIITDSVSAYNTAWYPAIPRDSRWNSYLNCCQSLISTKEALHSLAAKFEPSISSK